MSSIVFLGDSITQGVRQGISEFDTFSYKIGKARGFDKILNKGIPNDTAKNALARIQNDVINHSPKYCVIMLGTNDVFNKVSITDYMTSVIDIIKILKSNDIKPLIFSPSLGRSTEQIKLFPTYLVALETIGYQEEVPVIDIYRRFCHADLYLSKMDFNDLYADWAHLSAAGHQLITDIFLEEANNNLLNP